MLVSRLPSLRFLHWLSIHQRILHYKLANLILIVHRIVKPSYHANLPHAHTNTTHTLRYETQLQLPDLRHQSIALHYAAALTI